MSSLTEIKTAFSSIISEVAHRNATNQQLSSDPRIVHLVKTLMEHRNTTKISVYNHIEIANDHLSRKLTLLDFKTAYACGPAATALLVNHLQLQKNIDIIGLKFPFIERIQTASEDVLERISLFSLQCTGLIIPSEHSPLWYALATDDEFLNCRVLKLKKVEKDLEVIAAKITHIARTNTLLLDNYQDVTTKTTPSELTFRQLRLLSKEALHGIAQQLPDNAGLLLSDSQIQSLDFSRFSRNLLDAAVGGDATTKEIQRRYHLLNPQQLQIFIKKSSGFHFSKFPDIFFQQLSLSTLKKSQIEACFTSDNIRQLHLVSTTEVSKGFHLLSGNIARTLSSSQIASLDYSTMNQDQLFSLFYPYYYNDTNEYKNKIQQIPSHCVNDLLRKIASTEVGVHHIIAHFSPLQYQALNTSLLDKETVQILFPGFTIQTLYPGITPAYKHIRAEYQFLLADQHFKYSKEKLNEKIAENKAACEAMLKNFTPVQITDIYPKMNPECQSLVKSFIPLCTVV